MYFALLIRTDPELADDMAPQDFVTLAADVDAFDAQLTAAGQNLGSVRLGSSHEARVVRLRSGVPLVSDGPFAETREQVGGFYLVEAADIDAATQIAERLALAGIGSVEIRPILGIDLRTSVVHEADM
jgi:hypothetical protein